MRREHNLRPGYYPIRMRIVDAASGDVLWEHIATLANAPAEVRVPGGDGRATMVICDFGDGSRVIAQDDTITETRALDWPPATEED